jgi:hypothetical protein
MDAAAQVADNGAARLPRIRRMPHGTELADADAKTPPGRPAGIALAVLAALSLALLANHPSGAARSFAEVLRDEAANRGLDALVHGGFIAILAGQLVCFAILTIRIGLHRPLAVAGFVLTSIGAGFLMLSMLFDGLVMPAIAARYVDVVERHGDARTLFVFLGVVLSFLMPMGLVFQAAGLAAWSMGWLRGRGLVRATGLYGVAAAIAVIAGIAATGGTIPHVLMLSIIVVAAGYALVGAALLRRAL